MSELKIVKIKDILKMNFYIPDYQRGYRWEPQQAIDLLNDIRDFSNEKKGDNEIYCIQPLVVKKRSEEELIEKLRTVSSLNEAEALIKARSWEVVDGQQRLTTIHILLSIFKNDKRFKIQYQTRIGSHDFLEEISKMTGVEAMRNIDFYHMKKVHKEASKWLENQEDTIKERIKETLLEKVCFIWYETDSENSISVFTRLNIGKIPLTDAELIKALFLNRSNFCGSSAEIDLIQNKIAMQWDDIEYALQNDEFWLFLHETGYSKPTRIDFILDLICEKDKLKILDGLEGSIGTDEHKTFRYFYYAFEKKAKDKGEKAKKWIEEAWKTVKDYYQIFDEWYHDHKLYHYIGFLIEMKYQKINELVEKWEEKTKYDFVEFLKELIKVKVFSEWTTVETLRVYQFDSEGRKDKRACLPVLLLHNIETIIQQNEKLVEDPNYHLPDFSKFPFHLFKSERWDIEHISPASGDDFSRDSDKDRFLKLAKTYYPEIAVDINRFEVNGKSEKDNEKVSFEDVYKKIVELNGSLDEESKKRIWNFTLLDESTNREYQNAIFPVKRAYIANKENGFKTIEENGEIKPDKSQREIAFIPLCTKNVFAKFYTPEPDNLMNWTEVDAKSYFEDIADKLKYYFEEVNNGQ